MKKGFLIIIALSIYGSLHAQQSLSAAYFSHLLYQPGLKAGLQWSLPKQPALFIEPQIGFYSSPGSHYSLLASTELGYNHRKSDRKSFSAYSLGLGYLWRSRITDLRVQLGSGETEVANRSQKSYLLPTLNYTVGRSISTRLDAYSKFSLGWELDFKDRNALMLFIELGVRYHFNHQNSEK